MNEYYSKLDVGFACVKCSVTTRTVRGMILHLNVCHGIRVPLAADNDDPDPMGTDLPTGLRPRE